MESGGEAGTVPSSAVGPNAAGTKVAGAVVVGAYLAATGCILVAYRHGECVSARFTWFWLGLAAIAVLTGWLVSRRVGSPRARVLAVALAGVVTYVPKVLRSSSGPAYFDELLHLGQTQLLLGGHLFGGNSVVPVVGYYPVLQLLVAAVHVTTTLSLWDSDLVVIGIFHVMALLSVLLLVRELSGSERLASLAALFYLVGPAVLFFSSEASYESVGLPIAMVTLFAAVRGARGSRRWLAAAVVCSAITTLTQPVSGLFLMGTLILLGICSAAGKLGKEEGRQFHVVLLGLGLLAFVMNLGWIAVFDWNGTWSYLLPSLGTLQNLWEVLLRPTAGHHVFAGSSLPSYERAAGIAAVALALAAVLTGAVLHRSDRLREGPDKEMNPGGRLLWWTSLVMSLAFFASLPLDLSPRALLWAHRSWEFTWVGVACMLAFLVSRLVSSWRPWPWAARSALGALIAVGIVILLVGNTAITTNEDYMFPGAYRFGSGTSITTTSQLAAAAWMRAHAPSHARIASDPDTDLVEWSYAHETAVEAFPTWLLTFGAHGLTNQDESEARRYHLQYLLVDKLMYREVSTQGYVYSVYEPGAFSETKPVQSSAYAVLVHTRWLRLVYSNPQISIFQLVTGEEQSGVF